MIEVLARVDWTTVLVAAITGLSAVAGNLWLFRAQTVREQKSVRAALLAEVAALLDVIEKRGFVNSLRSYERFLEPLDQWQLDELDTNAFRYNIVVDSQFNRVYQQNVTRLGSLSPSEAKRIVQFHSLCESVRADVTDGGHLAGGSTSAEAWKEAADILEQAIAIGQTLVNPPRKWWHF